MTHDELFDYFKNRQLNSKTNNMIIIGEKLNTLINDIPTTTDISFIDDDIDINIAINIKIDLSKVDIKDVLTYALNYLKKIQYIDNSFDCTLPFNNKLVLLKFNSVLQKYNIVIQLIFYNMEELQIEEQMLFNELYYFKSFNSSYFNIISLTNNHFKTYFLTNNRVLDSREDYQRYEIVKPYTLTKKI